MREKLRERILDYNRTLAKNKECAEDLYILLGALPPGPVKQLLKEERCAAVLGKYGIGG